MKNSNLNKRWASRLLTSLLLCSILIVTFPTEAEAKFWGRNTTSVSDCNLGYQWECSDHYIFWIKVGSSCDPVGCSN